MKLEIPNLNSGMKGENFLDDFKGGMAAQVGSQTLGPKNHHIFFLI